MTESPSPAPGAGPTPPPYAAPPPYAVRPPLRRSRDDRVLAGVCGGVGRTLGVDPLLLRVLVVAFTIVGGAGLVAYLVAWLVVPEDGAATSEGQRLYDDVRRDPASTRSILAVLAAVVVAVVAIPLTFSLVLGGWHSNALPTLLLVALGVAAVAVWATRRPDPPNTAAPFPAPPPTGVTMTAPPGTDPLPTPDAPTTDAAPDPVVDTTTEGAPSPDAPATTAVHPGYDTVSYVGAPYDAASTATVGYAYGGTGGYGPYGYPPVPTPAPAAPGARRRRSPLGLLTVSMAVLVTGVIAAVDVAGASVPGVVYLAAPLTVLGVGLLVGALAGHAKWLLWIAVPLALVTALVAAVPAVIRDTAGAGIGDPVWRPTSVVAVSPDYRLAAGDATLDLRGVPLAAGVTTSARVGTGQLVVLVPRDATVSVDARVGVGELKLAGRPALTGTAITESTVLTPVGTSSGRIDLTLEVGAGNLEVRRGAA